MKRIDSRSIQSRLTATEISRLRKLLAPAQPAPDWDMIKSGSHKELRFRCPTCGSESARPVRNVIAAIRANRNPPCGHCYRRGGGINQEIARRNQLRIANNGSFAEIHPEIAREWDSARNELPPSAYAANSGFKANWICAAGHRWAATINGRVKQGSGCRKCGHHISQYEKRVFTELQALGLDVGWNERIVNVECDILLRQQRIVIEVDGFPWHDSDEAFARERRKEVALKGAGFTVIRWRCSRLRRRRPRSVTYIHEGDNVRSIKRLLSLALGHGTWRDIESARVREYCESASGYLAEDAFQRLHSTTATQLFRQSVADAYPELLGSWSRRNAPLTAAQVSKGSKRKVWWMCATNPAHEWQARPTDRRRFGCPHCNLRRASPLDNFYCNHQGFCDSYVVADSVDKQALQSRKLFASVRVRCVNGHRFALGLSNLNDARRSDSDKTFSCPKCKAVMPYDGSRLIKDPRRSAILNSWWDLERNRVNPYFLSPSQQTKYWWKCPLGHAFRRSVAQMFDARSDHFFCATCGSAKPYPKIAAKGRPRTSF